MNNMLTLEEVKSYLEADQPKIEELIKRRRLSAYKIGGTYLRFRKEEVLSLRSEFTAHRSKPPSKTPWFSKAVDFWRFNNFYIVSLAIVIALTLLAIQS